MNPKPNLGCTCLVLGLVLLHNTTFAQQGYYPPQPPRYTQSAPNYYNYQQPTSRRENPLDLIPKMGQKVGQWVRRVFYGEPSYQGYDQAPAYGGQGYSQPQPYSAAPSPGYYQQPAYQTPPASVAPRQPPPRYNYPPAQSQQQTPKRESPSAGRANGPTRQKYTPPKIQESKAKSSSPSPSKKITTVKPKPQDSPPPEPKEKESAAPRVPETVKPKEEPPTTSPSSSNSGSFLKGKKTSKPGRVISPYPPYKELDITGLDSGSLALDPTTQKVFEVP